MAYMATTCRESGVTTIRKEYTEDAMPRWKHRALLSAGDEEIVYSPLQISGNRGYKRYDSDTVMITDNPILIRAAQRHYEDFGVPTNIVESVRTKRTYTEAEQADLDIRTSVNLIGDIVNLSQELNSLYWHSLNHNSSMEELEPLYNDICQLDVMSGIEIDKAKKEFLIDNKVELSKIKRRYERLDDRGRTIKPNFFEHLARSKGYYDPAAKNYQPHDTTMDYVQQVVRSRTHKISQQLRQEEKKMIRFDQIFDRDQYDVYRVKYEQVRRVTSLLHSLQSNINEYYATSSPATRDHFKEQQYELQLLMEDCAQYIGRMRFSYSTMIYLLMCIERKDHRRISRDMFYMLFGYPNTSFYQAIQVSAGDLYELAELQDDEKCADKDEIRIYNFRFTKKKARREPIAPFE